MKTEPKTFPFYAKPNQSRLIENHVFLTKIWLFQKKNFRAFLILQPRDILSGYETTSLVSTYVREFNTMKQFLILILSISELL